MTRFLLIRHGTTAAVGQRLPGRAGGVPQALALKHPNELVAVISHSDIIKAAVAYYAGIHLDLFHRIEISPASVSIIELGDERVHIHLVNYTGGIEI